MHSEPPDIDEKLGINRHELRGLWSLTKKWRLDCVLEARDATRKAGDKGLRRGEIMNAIGRSLGLPKGHLVHDVAELFSLPESPQEKRAIRLFCRWMTECYQYNQAVEFESTASFPGYGSLDSLMTISVLPSNAAYTDLTAVPIIKERVPHPPLSILLEISPIELLQIRQDLGLGYFAALAAWQVQPTDANSQEVRRTLREYSEKLVEWAAKERAFANAILDVVHVAKTEQRSQQLLGSTINILKTFPGIETLIVLLEEGFAVHQVYAPPQDYSQIELKATVPTGDGLPEVNIPTADSKIAG